MRSRVGAGVAVLAILGGACTLLVPLDGLDDGVAIGADAAVADAAGGEAALSDVATDSDGSQQIDGSDVDASTACALAATTPNLVLYYQFEESTGTTVRDCSATKADGVLLGAASAAAVSVTGKIGRAFSFDGTNTCVSAGKLAALSSTGAFTLAAWVSVKQFPSVTSTAAIAGKSGSTALEGWRFGSDIGNVTSLKLGAPDGAFFAMASSVQPTMIWRHYATVFTPSTSGAIYVDGALNDTKSGGILAAVTPSAADFSVGCLGGVENYFNGSIDELRLYDRALSASEIQQLAAQAGP